MGKHDQVGQVKPYKCTYEDCEQRFDSIQEMKRHKYATPEHCYCRKCDVDCVDWEDLTNHKVDAMSPWLEGRMRGNKDVAPKHIVCEFCGQDFKSFGGRRKHVGEMHPADQHIKCPGCEGTFLRAAHMIAHLEFGRCTVISQDAFLDSAHHKHVNSQIEVDFGAWNISGRGTNDPAKPGLIKDSDFQDSEDGGVPILDNEHDEQKRGIRPLQAETKHQTTQRVQSAMSSWPRLPSHLPSSITDSVANMSIGSSSPSALGSEMSAGDYARRRRENTFTDSYPAIGSPSSTSIDDDHPDYTTSYSTVVVSNVNRRLTAWTGRQTSKALFPDQNPAPARGDWMAHMKQREDEIGATDRRAVLESRVWDPKHYDYNPEMFLNPVTEKYMCPFPDCDAEYEEAKHIEYHLQDFHIKTQHRCPSCLKIFTTVTSLVAHCESAGRCRVEDSTNYPKFIDIVSGGFLKVESVSQPRLYRPEKALVLASQPIYGVMRSKFEAKMPGER